jgi:hypothetical protein
MYFNSLQASGNLTQVGSNYYISSVGGGIDAISGYGVFYDTSYQQWIMTMRDMTYDQIVAQATAQGTFS